MTVEFETDKWPFVQAKSTRAVPGGKRQVRLIVIHSMEALEKRRHGRRDCEIFSESAQTSVGAFVHRQQQHRAVRFG